MVLAYRLSATRMTRRAPLPAVLAAVSLFSLASGSAQPTPGAPAPPAPAPPAAGQPAYIGSEMCQVCHEDIYSPPDMKRGR